VKLVLHGVCARHPQAHAHSRPALQTLSLGVAAGEQVAVIGPSGAGKTTLLQVMACALKPSTGAVHLDDRDPWTLARSSLQTLRGALFLAPQIAPLPPRQRVVTAVLAGRLPHQSLWGSLRSLLYPSDIALAEQCLAQFDLSDKLFERVDRLSGGERQRVGLARALASQAKLFLVDEPLSALDPARSQQAIETLMAQTRKRGATLVTTLHHVPMALAHFPRIIGVRAGELAFDLPAAQVTPQHLNDLYAQHLHELNVPDAVTSNDSVGSPAQLALPLPALQCR
jgi:phosphonate transport system ATP-binding protein